MQRRFSPALFGPLFCAGVLAICILVAHPFAEMGFNDDWSYVWSARALAQTGHLTYNGWGAMMVGWQLYLGALGIKLFGFSFTATRIGNILVSLATAALLQRTIVRCGIGEWNAILATLTVTLSPLFLPLAPSFMTDVPSFFCMLVCLYGCLRALESASRRHVLAWLAFAALSNVVLGTVRQVAWLGVLVMFPATVWCLRRLRGVLVFGLGLWAISGAAIFALLQWFKHQPYTFVETLKAKAEAPLKNDVHWLLTTVFLSLPVLIAFLVRYPFRRKTRWTAVLLGMPLAYVAVLYAVTLAPANWLAPFSWDEFTTRGFQIPGTLIGYPPDVMRLPMRIALTLLTVFAATAVLYFLRRPRAAVQTPATASRLPGMYLFWLLGPFTAAYLLLVLTREFIFDRYDIPVVFVLLVALLRVYEERVSLRLPALSIVALVFLALASVAETHDVYAELRARLAADSRLVAAGVPRDRFYGGLEYDGWTELQQKGYINNPRVAAWLPTPYEVHEPEHPDACAAWWGPWMPGIRPEYALSYQPLACLRPAPFGPFPYTTWMAPHHRDLYLLKIPQDGSYMR